MYKPSVETLQAFYASKRGQILEKQLKKTITTWWPSCHGISTVGLGYAGTYLIPYVKSGDTVLLCMQTLQSSYGLPNLHYPLACLASETHLPLADESVDRVVILHCLEYSEAPHAVLREIWRVLKPEGVVILGVPVPSLLNLSKEWLLCDHTTHAFTLQKLSVLMQDAMFSLLRAVVLFYLQEPVCMTRLSNAFCFWQKRYLVLEARKQLYSSRLIGKAEGHWNIAPARCG